MIRWTVALMGTALQLCLGTVYAWSFFQKPLMSTYGWSNAQTAATFSIAICFLGLAAAWGGTAIHRTGPRKLALCGAALYGGGHIIAAIALSVKSLALLYLGYGVVGGIGLGLGYVTPVATVVKWFPERKGLVTGMVVMGFGFGALVMSKLAAPRLLDWTKGSLPHLFAWSGVFLLAIAIPAAVFLRNPPKATSAGASAPPLREALPLLATRAFAALWGMFFLNITAGIMFIGFQSPLLQDILRNRSPELDSGALAAAGATLIAASSIFNGLGRFLWGTVSDTLGRSHTFRLLFTTQILAFGALFFATNPWVFGSLVCYVLLCYGGGFGTMPSFVLDLFGPAHMPFVYGSLLTAWSAAGLCGPQLAALIKDASPDNAGTLTALAGMLLICAGLAVSFLLKTRARVQALS